MTGVVEIRNHGTNRVIAMCKKHGAAPRSVRKLDRAAT